MIPKVTVRATYNSATSYALQGSVLALIGPADDGPFEPTSLTSDDDAYTVFRGGPLAFWAAWLIRNFRINVLALRAASTAVSAFSAVTRTAGHGASVVTVHSGSATDINADVRVWVTVGGTVGVAGISYRVTTNGGLTYATAAALGTATSIAVTLGTATLTLDLTAAALVADEVIGVTASSVAAGSYATLDSSLYPLGTNTAVASMKTATYPDDDYDVIVEFPVGGTLGTTGITWRYSVGGALAVNDWSMEAALGTDLEVSIPGTGTTAMVLGTAGQTIGNGARLRVRCYAPNFNSASVQVATIKMFENQQDWRLLAYCGGFDAGIALAVEALFATAFEGQLNGERAWVANARMPTLGETDAAYFTSMQALSAAARHCYFGGIGYGDAKYVSNRIGTIKRPIALTVAARLFKAPYDEDIARTDRPGLPVTLADDNGRPDCHDEYVMPGPDDYGFITLRTEPEGIFVTNPRLFAPANAIVEMYPHRLAWNEHTRLVRATLRKLLSVQIRAAKAGGRILEADAHRVEKALNSSVDSIMGEHISGQEVTLSRTDDLLGNRPAKLHASGKLLTLIYIKEIEYTTEVVASLVAST